MTVSSENENSNDKNVKNHLVIQRTHRQKKRQHFPLAVPSSHPKNNDLSLVTFHCFHRENKISNNHC